MKTTIGIFTALFLLTEFYYILTELLAGLALWMTFLLGRIRLGGIGL